MSKAARELTDAVEAWRDRDLSQEKIKYIIVDGVSFPMRVDGSIERVPVLVAIGVREDGRRIVLGLQAGDKESASSWRQFMKDLKRRGLDPARVKLAIMDGLPGLEKVFEEEKDTGFLRAIQGQMGEGSPLGGQMLGKIPGFLSDVLRLS